MATYYVSALAPGGGSGSIGSPWTYAQFLSASFLTGDRIFIKGDGTYSSTGTKTINLNNVWIEGYSVTPGDGGQATIATSGTNQGVFSITGTNSRIKNLIIDGGGFSTNTNTVLANGGASSVKNVVIQNVVCSSNPTALVMQGGAEAAFCTVKNCTIWNGSGALTLDGGFAHDCTIFNITGVVGTVSALRYTNGNSWAQNITIYSISNGMGVQFFGNNGGNYYLSNARITNCSSYPLSIQLSSTLFTDCTVENCVLSSTATAISNTATVIPTLTNVTYYGTKTGTGTAIETNLVSLGADPFTSSTDLHLTAAATTSLRNAGNGYDIPLSWPSTISGGAPGIGSQFIPSQLL